jgi:hypothetical protein
MTAPTLSNGRPYRSSRTPGTSAYAFLNSRLMGTMTGDSARTRDSYLRALPYNPDDFNAHYRPAIVYSLKHLPNARKQIEQALSLNPYDPEALRVRSQLPQARPGGLPISAVLRNRVPTDPARTAQMSLTRADRPGRENDRCSHSSATKTRPLQPRFQGSGNPAKTVVNPSIPIIPMAQITMSSVVSPGPPVADCDCRPEDGTRRAIRHL